MTDRRACAPPRRAGTVLGDLKQGLRCADPERSPPCTVCVVPLIEMDDAGSPPCEFLTIDWYQWLEVDGEARWVRLPS